MVSINELQFHNNSIINQIKSIVTVYITLTNNCESQWRIHDIVRGRGCAGLRILGFGASPRPIDFFSSNGLMSYVSGN